MIVIKVGGSLFNLPGLKSKLQTAITKLAVSDSIIIIPGGGALSDIVRQWDIDHGIGDEQSHWLALETMTLASRFLTDLLEFQKLTVSAKPGIYATLEVAGSNHHDVQILDSFRWLKTNDCLPHSWNVTSDSIALKYAIMNHATRIILFKSAARTASASWDELAEIGFVDRHFPTLVKESDLIIDCINLRDNALLDDVL